VNEQRERTAGIIMNTPVTVNMTKISGKEDSSYPVGSIIEGPQWNKPKVGEIYKLDGYIKTSLNERFEWFSTTPVLSIDNVKGGGIIISTENSKWRINEL